MPLSVASRAIPGFCLLRMPFSRLSRVQSEHRAETLAAIEQKNTHEKKKIAANHRHVKNIAITKKQRVLNRAFIAKPEQFS